MKGRFSGVRASKGTRQRTDEDRETQKDEHYHFPHIGIISFLKQQWHPVVSTSEPPLNQGGRSGVLV